MLEIAYIPEADLGFLKGFGWYRINRAWLKHVANSKE